MTRVEFRGVSKSYGTRIAVSNVSFAIDSGERVVLAGPSGCGKTTVLRLLAGFIPPDEGTILLNGSSVSDRGRIVVEPEHRRLGMVFQDLALWPHLTVRGNLDFVLRSRRVAPRDREMQIIDMLRRVQLEDYASAHPSELSGGQQQRVAVARALMANPVAVLMDEPLANLDDELKRELCEQILRLHAQLGFTLIYVTHSNEEMRLIASRTILMQAGSVVTRHGLSDLPGRS
jgi:iron(III) transport system ATP-binding protein